MTGETKKIHYKFCQDSVPTEIRIEYLQVTSLLSYRYNNLLDSFMAARNALFLLLTLSAFMSVRS
jgi:hypothetical protein